MANLYEPVSIENASDGQVDLDHIHRFATLFPNMVTGGGVQSLTQSVWATLLGSQRDAGIGGNLLEIGVWQGHGSGFAAMYRNASEQLIIFDKFASEPGFLPNLMQIDAGAADALVFFQGCSIAARKRNRASAFVDSVRWAHIDGEHSYEALMSDLDMVSDLMTEDGVIVIDDIFSYASPSLTEAMFTWLRRNEEKYVPFLIVEGKAYLCSPRKLRHYLRTCHTLPAATARNGHRTMLCMSGWSAERPYFGLDYYSPAGMKYQRINEQFEDASLAGLFFG